jgi:hypothetical protein
MDIDNMKSEDIKKIMKENRKFKDIKWYWYNKNKLYWKCWNVLNERYNMGDV